jgi:voltage-gated potassium channel Kch
MTPVRKSTWPEIRKFWDLKGITLVCAAVFVPIGMIEPQIYAIFFHEPAKDIYSNVLLMIFNLLVSFGTFLYVIYMDKLQNRWLWFLGVYYTSTYMVQDILLYTNIYRHLGLVHQGELVTNVTDFLYFSIVTWTTLGYGDIVPTPEARLFAASEALFGYFTMALYIALIIQALTPRRSAQSR